MTLAPARANLGLAADPPRCPFRNAGLLTRRDRLSPDVFTTVLSLRETPPDMTGSQTALTPSDALIAALTVEGLLFAAFSFAWTLAQESAKGRHPFFTQAWFGWIVVGIIAAVAAAAGAGWWGIYSPVWPHDTLTWIESVGLASGIVAQPIFAAIINLQAK